jgi:hypothetical protein
MSTAGSKAPKKAKKAAKARSPKKTKGPPAPADIYVGLLFVSLAALVGGCVFLVLELNKYGWQLAPQ